METKKRRPFGRLQSRAKKLGFGSHRLRMPIVFQDNDECRPVPQCDLPRPKPYSSAPFDSAGLTCSTNRGSEEVATRANQVPHRASSCQQESHSLTCSASLEMRNDDSNSASTDESPLRSGRTQRSSRN